MKSILSRFSFSDRTASPQAMAFDAHARSKNAPCHFFSIFFKEIGAILFTSHFFGRGCKRSVSSEKETNTGGDENVFISHDVAFSSSGAWYADL